MAKLSREVADRIVKKLRSNAALVDPLSRAEPLVDLPPATHRFRVGKYRVSFFIRGGTIFVERVQPRNEAYRR